MLGDGHKRGDAVPIEVLKQLVEVQDQCEGKFDEAEILHTSGLSHRRPYSVRLPPLFDRDPERFSPGRVQPLPNSALDPANRHMQARETHDTVGAFLLPGCGVHRCRDGLTDLADQPLVGKIVRLPALSNRRSSFERPDFDAVNAGASHSSRASFVRRRRARGTVANFVDMALFARRSG